MKIRNYFIIILVIFISIFIYSHIRILTKQNNKTEILQAETPNSNKIQELLLEKSPTIFRQVLYGWNSIIEIFDKDINEIQLLLKNKELKEDIINNLNAYSMFLSLGWDYNMYQKQISDNHFRLETNHRHLICQIMGTQIIYLASPKQKNKFKNTIKDKNKHNNIISSVNFWNENEITEKPFNTLEYIKIILREGNILYIPNGWWYLCEIEEESLVLDSYNISLFSFFL